jgi:hypothetical protein
MAKEPKKKRWVAIYAAALAGKVEKVGFIPHKGELQALMNEASDLADAEEELRTRLNNEGWDIP